MPNRKTPVSSEPQLPVDPTDVTSQPTAAEGRERPPAELKPVAKDNLALWRSLERTDPKATKPFTRSGGFRGTQIDPTWRLKRMTEAFGPVGEGWGYDVIDTRVESGMVFCLVRAWYVPPSEDAVFGSDTMGFNAPVPTNARFTGAQWGGTTIFKQNNKDKPDDECFKMSVTDALGKCLSQIGVAADVYLGMFDDSKYRDESEQVYRSKEDEEKKAEADRLFQQDKQVVAGFLKEIASAPNAEALRKTVGEIGTQMKLIGERNAGLATQVRTAIAKRKDELSQGETVS